MERESIPIARVLGYVGGLAVTLLFTFAIDSVTGNLERLQSVADDHERRIVQIESTRFTLGDSANLRETLASLSAQNRWLMERIERLESASHDGAK